MKKRGIDHRQDASGSSKANRVDRVFIPNPGTVTPRPSRESASQIASELLATTRAPTNESVDSDLSLRRQLSRLQRQLAESQRELANKDDEVAAEVEKRLQTQRELEDLREINAATQAKLDELGAYEARTAGIEARLQDSIAAADELVQVNRRERAATADALAKVNELNNAFEATRSLWNAERGILEERYTNEIATLDGQRKAAVEASADALNAQAARLREAHEAQLVELRATHEQSLATLRGELEPQAVQAHSLAEERERLIAELATVRNETIRDTVEREEEYKRELQQTIDAKDAELAAATRTHAAELARVTNERDAQIIGLQETIKAADSVRTGLEEQAESLRQTLKTVQRDVAELREKVTALEVDKQSADEALERSRQANEALTEDKRKVAEQLATAVDESRRNVMERRKFVAYLEEGLALLGALPPTAVSDAIPTIEAPSDGAPRSDEPS
jgi:DNA repair exonuclease SbcCD ATPase subunit